MRLKSLSILNYKNIAEASLDFCDGLNCFVGLNGMGKTNVLDAIYYLSFCKSHLGAIDSQNISHQADFFLLQGTYRLHGQEEDIQCSIKRRQKKHFRRNKREYERLSDHIGLLPLVLISPSDQLLIAEGSDERRKFVDGVISQYDRDYLRHLLAYNQALMQRNALLKLEDRLDLSMLGIYEEQMVPHAEYIYRERTAFLQRFIPIFQRYYALVSEGSEEVGLSYRSQLQDRELGAALQATRQRDLLLGWTSQGIHKDDLDMTLGQYALKRTGSQGQQKTYLIAMKLAQYELLRQTQGTKPIVLLDDLFDKLDTHRMERIIDIVSGSDFGQIFITDTDRSHLTESLEHIAAPKLVFEVTRGQVVPVNS